MIFALRRKEEEGIIKKLVKELQCISYQILCDVDKFCEDNNLTYFLSGGTCLGAVRHHGFIPWDDDVDIMLPRRDYEKLLKNFVKSFDGKYKLGCLNTDPQWSRPAARIWNIHTELTQTKLKEIKMGVFIDVFPIDGLPKSSACQEIYFITIKALDILRNAARRTEFYEGEKYRILKIIIGWFAKLFGGHFWASQIEKIIRRFPIETSDYVGAIAALHYGKREKIEKKYMENEVRIPFESRNFPVPVGYDRYLKNLYGDYMKIPKDASEKSYTHLDGWDVKLINNERKDSQMT